MKPDVHVSKNADLLTEGDGYRAEGQQPCPLSEYHTCCRFAKNKISIGLKLITEVLDELVNV